MGLSRNDCMGLLGMVDKRGIRFGGRSPQSG